MTMPVDLVLVRHGESEGNVANRRSRAGDDSAFTEEFLQRHSSRWRLTDLGRAQAQAAGQWLRRQVSPHFDRYYTSEYLRAKETAALLELDRAEWYADFHLRERDWGQMDVITHQERLRLYGRELEKRKFDSFYWTPPSGESMAQVCLRVDRVVATLHRECSDKRVIVVCHGEVMWSFRIRLERMPQSVYQELDRSEDPRDEIHNAQILHYTRRDPVSDRLYPYLSWFRSVCPWDPSLSWNEWQPITRKRYSNEELLREVNQVQRLVQD